MSKQANKTIDFLRYYDSQNKIHLSSRRQDERSLVCELGIVLLVYLVAFIVILIVLSQMT